MFSPDSQEWVFFWVKPIKAVRNQLSMKKMSHNVLYWDIIINIPILYDRGEQNLFHQIMLIALSVIFPSANKWNMGSTAA